MHQLSSLNIRETIHEISNSETTNVPREYKNLNSVSLVEPTVNGRICLSTFFVCGASVNPTCYNLTANKTLISYNRINFSGSVMICSV